MEKTMPKLIMLQFSFGNQRAVPWVLQQYTRNTQKKSASNTPPAGTEIIPPTKNVSVWKAVEDLEAGGYHLIDMYCEKRNVNGQHFRGENSPYTVVCFLFGDTTTSLGKPRGVINGTTRPTLQRICDEAFWEVRAYENPSHDAKEDTMWSINLKARSARVTRDGNKVKKWKKSRSGEKIGDGPIPIWSDASLHIEDGAMCIK